MSADQQSSNEHAKQFLALICALVLMVALLSGCGGSTTENASSSGNGATNSSSGTASNGASGKADTSTVAGFLSQYGLTEDDLRPEASSVAKLQDGDTVLFSASAQPNDEQRSAWLNKVAAKAKTLSDDGKLYAVGYAIGTSGAKEFDSSTIKPMGIYQFAFPYKGKAIVFTITAFGELDGVYSLAILN